MGTPLKILVTGAGAPGFPGIVKSLRENGERTVRIIGTDMREDVVGFHLADQRYIVPSGLDPAYPQAILDIVTQEKVDVILPLCTFELLPLARAKEAIEDDGAKIAVSDIAPLTIAISKAQAYKHLRGDFIPDYRVVNSFRQFKTATDELGYPRNRVAFKPSIGRGMRGFRIVDDHINQTRLLFNQKPQSTLIGMAEAKAILRSNDFPELVVMEYLPGAEYSVDTLAKHGHTYYAIVRERIETRRGISYIGQVEKNGVLEAASREIIRQLGLDYNVNLQFKAAEDGDYKLVEINPRVSGSIIFCVSAGVNLPYFAIKLARGEAVPTVPVRYGTKIYRHWTEVVA